MPGREERLLRVGILGCGPIAQYAHFDACRKARNAELYAICDTAEDLVDRMRAVHDPRVTFTDYADMLADEQVEAVIVAASDSFHVSLSLQALEAGKHVLVEKPLGVTIEECEQLRDKVRETGLTLQVGTNRRFDPGVRYARRFVADEMGQPLGFRAWYYDSVHRYTQTDNVLPIPVHSDMALRPDDDPKADRQRYLLIAHGSHLVDTVRFIGGSLRGVSARCLQRFGAYCWFVSVEFEDGCLGHLDLTVPLRGDFEEGFHASGEHGSVFAKGSLPWYHKAWTVECYSAKDGVYRRPFGEDAHTYKLEVEGFAETCLDDTPMIGANVDDGLAAVRGLVAIARSAERDGAWTTLEEVSRGV